MFLKTAKISKFILSAVVLAGVLWSGAALAQKSSAVSAQKSSVTDVSVQVLKSQDAVVAELFTSQGCSSCPPADAFLGELANRADVIPLEMHIDYWNHTKSLFGGTWKDPFSNAAWTQRQQNYNRVLLNSDKVFTPQLVIDGRYQDVGTRRQSVLRQIEQAKAQRRQHFNITATLNKTGAVQVAIAGPGLKNPANVLLLHVISKASTQVTGGENNGATLHNRNIATEMMTLGTYAGGKETYAIKMGAPKRHETCVVVLQDPDNMQILSAHPCTL